MYNSFFGNSFSLRHPSEKYPVFRIILPAAFPAAPFPAVAAFFCETEFLKILYVKSEIR
jgi:hypothetical protein